MRVLIIILAMVLTVAAMLTVIFGKGNSDSSLIKSGLPIEEEYPSLPASNNVKKESLDDIIDRFENGSGVIFLGTSSCEWCQKIMPIVNESAESEQLTVSYLDVYLEKEINPSGYSRLITILSPHLQKDELGRPKFFTPDISIVKNGLIVWRYQVENVTEDEKTPETYWTNERKQRAYETFRTEMGRLND